MTKETLIKILSEKSMPFSEKEINEMLDAELEKAPEEMDTDFVNLCLDVLGGKYGEGYYAEDDNSNNGNGQHSRTKIEKENDETKNRKRKIKFGRILLIAAIIAAVLACSITAGAKFVQINASEDTVSYDGDHFSIDLNTTNQEDTVDDIVETLVIDGVKNVILPGEILSDEYVISGYSSNGSNINFEFQNNKTDVYGTLNINIYDEDSEFSYGEFDISDEYYSVTEININKTKTLVLKADNSFLIVYGEGNKEYTVTLYNCNSEYATKIAKTVGEKT
ncbi:MAG TPA: hypothetical protein IAA24_01590 [Candidatus Eubacterium faecigallinarum]|nr:hypothetical protein [Candidatus Eubacterium faecigallinarum]